MNGDTRLDITIRCENEPEAVRVLRQLRDAGLLARTSVAFIRNSDGRVQARWGGEGFLGHSSAQDFAEQTTGMRRSPSNM